MITEADIHAKSDQELLHIWQCQIDYRDDVVGWVNAEIVRRGLSTDHLDSLTAEDQAQREEDWYRSVSSLRPIFRLTAVGALLLVFGISLLLEAFNQPEKMFLAATSAALCIGGTLLLALARRSANRRRSLLQSRRWKQFENAEKSIRNAQ